MIGEQIYKLRKKNVLSQEDLASELGVSRQTISNWESGQTTPDLKQATKLAEVFDVSLDELSEKEKTISVKVETKKPIMSFWKGVGIVVVGLLGFYSLVLLFVGLLTPNNSEDFEDSVEIIDEAKVEFEPMDASVPSQRLICYMDDNDPLMIYVETDASSGVVWDWYSSEASEVTLEEIEKVINTVKIDKESKVDVDEIMRQFEVMFTSDGFSCQKETVR